MPRQYSRTASLVISFLGTFSNLVVALQLVFLWSSFNWELESEWDAEDSPSSWLSGIQGVKLAWGLFCAYFAATATANAVGLVGIIKQRPSYVRFYRDYSIADFSFCTFFTIVATYESFRSSVKAGVCEELSRQPELLRDMTEMGLNLENCELWFERASVAGLGVMAVMLLVRLHFLVAVLNYYCQLTRRQHGLPMYAPMRSVSHSSAQRVYLLPSPTDSCFPISHHTTSELVQDNNDNETAYIVYAPVPLSVLSEEDARKLNATEAWLSRSIESTKSSQKRDRSHSHRHRHSTGRISLAVLPDEGLLPAYEEASPKESKA